MKCQVLLYYISYNGKHFAIEFNGKVYDNIHPNGIEFNEWISDFDSSGVISYIIEEIGRAHV